MMYFLNLIQLLFLSADISLVVSRDVGLENDLYEGDIAVRTSLPLNSSSSLNLAALRDVSKIWPGGKVPYRIDTKSIPNQNDQDLILAAMATLSRKVSCIEFEDNDQVRKFDYVRIAGDGDTSHSSSGCWSYLGMVGGEQTLNLGTGCFKEELILHEFLHLLGFIHEQNRPDRDDFVDIIWSNVQPGMKKQFEKRNEDDVDMQDTPYDFRSRMHYTAESFSKSNAPTIVAYHPGNDNFGPLDKLSPTDIVEISMLYRCNIQSNVLVNYNHANRYSNEVRIDQVWDQVDAINGTTEAKFDDINEQLEDMKAQMKIMSDEFEQMKTEMKQMKTKNEKLNELNGQLSEQISNISKRMPTAVWELGLNINPCDGEDFGYGGPWSKGVNVGTSAQAFTRDFIDINIWKKPSRFITIARHVNGQCTMSKTWELKDNTRSMYSYFSTYPGRIYATGDGSRSDNHIASDIPLSAEGLTGTWRDPIFGAEGGLVFNWYTAWDGARIALPGGFKVPYTLPGTTENNDDLHGLGVEFGARTINGHGSANWKHDVGKIGPDCQGSTCQIVGTDCGSRMIKARGACWGSYAIFVSQDAKSFNCQGKALSTTVDWNSAA